MSALENAPGVRSIRLAVFQPEKSRVSVPPPSQMLMTGCRLMVKLKMLAVLSVMVVLKP